MDSTSTPTHINATDEKNTPRLILSGNICDYSVSVIMSPDILPTIPKI
jgi:hypothetical protein